MRRNRADIEQQLRVIVNKTAMPFTFDWTARRPRLVLHGRDISPRLTPTKMYDWLEAMDEGLIYGARAVRNAIALEGGARPMAALDCVRHRIGMMGG